MWNNLLLADNKKKNSLRYCLSPYHILPWCQTDNEPNKSPEITIRLKLPCSSFSGELPVHLSKKHKGSFLGTKTANKHSFLCGGWRVVMAV
jgi:hypothetical protein